MRPFRICCLLFAASFFTHVVYPQSVSAPNVATMLQQSVAAQTGGVATSDLNLTGTISFPHSAQTGTFPLTLTVLANGTSKMVTALASGTVTHVWSLEANTPSVTVTGPNGKTQARPAGQDTLMPTAAWFAPIVISSLASGS